MTQEHGHTQLSIGKHNITDFWTNIVKTRHILWVLYKTESHFASVKHPNLQMYYTKCFYGMVNTKSDQSD